MPERKNMKKKDDEIEIVEINTEFIKLDQLLKWANFTASGVESKMFILNGEVKVNGEVETRRGKKIYDGYIVEFNGEKIKVKAPTE
jgi:S4 domain protein yaaA